MDSGEIGSGDDMRRAGSWFFLGCLIVTAAWGDCSESSRPPERFGAAQYQWENDSFDPSNPSDSDYTSGLRFAWTRNPCAREPPQWTHKLVEVWCRTGICGGDRHNIDVGWAFGQSIYTPFRYVTPRPQPNDRPYAGHLFGSWLIQATHSAATSADDEERVQTTFELQLGLVGPHAYGEEVQNGWHRLLKEREAEGWANQLEDEPTLNLNLLWRRKLGGRHLDFVPHWGIALGTVSTHANLGATLRVGTDLSRLPQFGLPHIRRNEWKRSIDVSAFVAADGRYVARNLFLDGGVFEKLVGSRIEREDFVYDLKTGLNVRFLKTWTFHYTWTHRSREFESRTRPDGGEQIFRSYAVTHHLTWP